ncbi:MAG: hypothetical protein OXC91_10745 [Rhodobacteraceae bacterium]|nr:hypothetical protein [Paracoccaceae bacterium]
MGESFPNAIASVDCHQPLLYHPGMDYDPDIHALAKQMAVMEERMTSMKAKYEGALDRNNAAFERLRADMALHREDGAKR